MTDTLSCPSRGRRSTSAPSPKWPTCCVRLDHHRPEVPELEAACPSASAAGRCGWSTRHRVARTGAAACGIGPGDEVITTPLSWVATANVVVAVGATPVFVDADPRTRNIDLDRVEAAITPRTRALHAGRPGRPAGRPGPPLRHRAASMACGWSRTRRSPSARAGAGGRIGSFGDLVSFSFHANKNMTSGEGGCLVLNDDDEARRFEMLRLQGVQRLPDGDGRRVPGRQGQHDRHRGGDRPGPAAQHRRLQSRAARQLAGAISSAGTADARLRAAARRRRRAHGNWHMFQPLLPPTPARRRARLHAAP